MTPAPTPLGNKIWTGVVGKFSATALEVVRLRKEVQIKLLMVSVKETGDHHSTSQEINNNSDKKYFLLRIIANCCPMCTNHPLFLTNMVKIYTLF